MVNGKRLELTASSLGGGQIRVCEINGLTANFSGEYPTLIVNNQDRPGIVNEVTATLAGENVNIAAMQLYRSKRGSSAVMILECDGEIPQEDLQQLKSLPGILDVAYLSLKETEE